MSVQLTTVGDLFIADEPGFACSKTKLVDIGLIHLRPFNIAENGDLDLREIYRVPPGEAAKGRANLEPGDILFNNTNSAELVGKSALVSTAMEAGFSNHLNRIRVDKSRVDPQWFSFWLRKRRESGFFTRNATRWVSQAAFKSSELRMLSIELPSLSEQRCLADILSRADGIVRMRREAEAKAKQIIPALFVDMFGDPGTNPKGWAVRTISDLVSAVDYGSSTKAGEGTTGVPMIRMGNVDVRGRLKLGDLKYVVMEEADRKKYGLKAGDILFNRTNSRELVGKTGIWRSGDDAVAASYFIRVRVNELLLAPDYLWAFMNSPHMKKTLFGMARGAIGQSNINSQELRAIPLAVPALTLQRTFSERVREFLELERSQEVATVVSEAVFQSLLAGVFQP